MRKEEEKRETLLADIRSMLTLLGYIEGQISKTELKGRYGVVDAYTCIKNALDIWNKSSKKRRKSLRELFDEIGVDLEEFQKFFSLKEALEKEGKMSKRERQFYNCEDDF